MRPLQLLFLSTCAMALRTTKVKPFYAGDREQTQGPLGLVKRNEKTLEVPLTNIEYSYYMLNLTIGSEGQTISGALDTGSSDIWVLGGNCPVSKHQYSNSCTLNESEFNSALSSTFVYNDTLDFQIIYADETYASGYWGHDTVSPGGLFDIDDLSIAVANYTNASDLSGVFGVGLKTLEQTLDSKTNPYTYENLPLKMRANGLIEKTIFSLFLNNITAPYGSILFGGIDHSKYSGDLQTVNFTGYGSTTVRSFLFKFEGVSYNGNVIANEGYYALLDSGSTLLYVPPDILADMASKIDSSWSDDFGFYVTGCSIPDPEDGYEFLIGDIKIKVPFNQLLVTMSSDPEEYTYKGNQLCALGIAESSDDVFIFGDMWLSSAYVVFDIDNLEAKIGQAKYSDVEPTSFTTESTESHRTTTGTQFSSSSSSISSRKSTSKSVTKTNWSKKSQETSKVTAQTKNQSVHTTKTSHGSDTHSQKRHSSSWKTGPAVATKTTKSTTLKKSKSSKTKTTEASRLETKTTTKTKNTKHSKYSSMKRSSAIPQTQTKETPLPKTGNVSSTSAVSKRQEKTSKQLGVTSTSTTMAVDTTYEAIGNHISAPGALIAILSLLFL